MENAIETTETLATVENGSFAVDLGKSFAISVATTAGMVAGMAVVGFVGNKLSERKARKLAATQDETTTE